MGTVVPVQNKKDDPEILFYLFLSLFSKLSSPTGTIVKPLRTSTGGLRYDERFDLSFTSEK